MKDGLLFPEEINNRVENGMGCHSQIGEGWFDIVRKLDAKIAKVYPDYVVDQVKEKFGVLCYYVGVIPKEYSKEINGLIRTAEKKSTTICDVCGNKGETGGKHWLATRCKKHRN